jgi:hypothetical protein
MAKSRLLPLGKSHDSIQNLEKIMWGLHESFLYLPWLQDDLNLSFLEMYKVARSKGSFWEQRFFKEGKSF